MDRHKYAQVYVQIMYEYFFVSHRPRDLSHRVPYRHYFNRGRTPNRTALSVYVMVAGCERKHEMVKDPDIESCGLRTGIDQLQYFFLFSSLFN